MLTIVLKSGKAMQYRCNAGDGQRIVEELNNAMNNRASGRATNYSWVVTTDSGIFTAVVEDIALVSYDNR